jgi:putative photosynthetic complex assembly protein 2
MIPSPVDAWAQIYLYPLLVTMGLWSSLTLGLLWMNRRTPRQQRVVMLLLLAGVALLHHQLWSVRNDLTAWGCYTSFIAGMLIWTWHELAFYSGVLTGPWRKPCPPEARGRQRFRYALGTHLYHEIAIILEMLLLGWMLRDAANQIGLLTLVLGWALMQSAKLNVLLGVRSLPVHWLPEHLRYLGSFWAQRPSNPFFLPSILISSLVAGLLWLQSVRLAPDPSAIGMTLLAVLATLGVLDHWLLVLPLYNQQPASNRRHDKVTG